MKACPSMRQPETKLSDVSAPRLPIPGAAGVSINAALASMAMHAGAMSITITKSRVAGGGYAYSIARNLTPASR